MGHTKKNVAQNPPENAVAFQVQETKVDLESFRMLAEAIPNLAWIAHPDGSHFWYNQRRHRRRPAGRTLGAGGAGERSAGGPVFRRFGEADAGVGPCRRGRHAGRGDVRDAFRSCG